MDAGGAHDCTVGQEVEERLDHEKAGDHVRLRCSPMTLQEHDNAHGHDCHSKAEPEVVRSDSVGRFRRPNSTRSAAAALAASVNPKP